MPLPFLEEVSKLVVGTPLSSSSDVWAEMTMMMQQVVLLLKKCRNPLLLAQNVKEYDGS